MMNTFLRALVVGLLLVVSNFAQSKQADWRTATPESQGVDSAALAEAITQARAKGLAIHSLLVVRNGYLIAEAYFFPYNGKTPHDIASVTKPITTTLIGLAIAQGKIKSVQEPLLSFFSERRFKNVDERKRRITLEHLLTMSSGLDCAGRGEPALWNMFLAADNTQFMLDLPTVSEPGAQYAYCSGGMHLLSSVISKTTGMNAEAFARQHLFAPLGIRNFIWPHDPQGVSHGFGNLHLLPRDMAKLGWLFLNQGKWEGKQIVPADWVAKATSSHIKTGGAGTSDYGYGWRVPPNGPIAFEAGGRGGQQISVLPSKNAVIVFNGGGFANGEVMKQVLAAFKSDTALPANPAGTARLQAAIKTVSQQLAIGKHVEPELVKKISGKTFVLEQNWLGLQSLSLQFGAETVTARLQFGFAFKQAQWGTSAKARGKVTIIETRPVGLHGAPRFSPNGIHGAPVALTGYWEDEQTFVLEYDEVSSTNCSSLRITFTDDGVSIRAKERTGLFEETFAGKPVRQP
ncbi:MAG: serine hydrolase [Acidobacteria bacterium]|nr:serine hydrolase [Acidobacteriota bacterium]